MNILKLAVFATLLISFSSCKDDDSTQKPDETETAKEVKIPIFNENNAYSHIEKQVAFGPRIPNSKAQEECAIYLETELKKVVDTVYRQETTIKAQDGKSLRCINLVGAINPKASRRVLLLAHWDSRPWADQEDATKPVLGANDGASGVGVLLELGNVLKNNPIDTSLGIDILFVDVEDYGKTEWGEDSYGLGTQYWARNPHVAGYKAMAGILLDMVGGKNARFALEGISRQYAPAVQQSVWTAATKAGYSSYFVFEEGGSITDDHVFVNKIAGIPTIDIIDLPRGSNTGFVKEWHTTTDDMSVIDQKTLKAVGQTLLQYIYTL